jgi:ribose 5-phosphate isomerase A
MSEPSATGLEGAASAALALVKSGMKLGLGTGRAAEAFIRGLGERVKAGFEVTGVTTSERSERLARELSIPLSTVDDTARLDLAFDGADEVDPALDLVKGLGGALLRERVVASLADRFVVLVTPEKRVERLGSRAPIPVEVVPFAVAVVERALRSRGSMPMRRLADGAPYRTDNGNAIVDVHTSPLDDPWRFHREVREIPGVVDTGLFLGMADLVLVGHDDRVERLERSRG